MQVRTIKPGNFLFFRTSATIAELERFLPVGQELYKEAVLNNIPITGPIQWHYFNFQGDPEKPFTLEVGLPVAKVADSYDGKFHFKRTESFRCVSTIHSGDWTRLPETYQLVFEFIRNQNLNPVSVNREVYINSDFVDTEANLTEVQIGIEMI